VSWRAARALPADQSSCADLVLELAASQVLAWLETRISAAVSGVAVQRDRRTEAAILRSKILILSRLGDQDLK